MHVDGVLYLEEHLTEARLQEKCVLTVTRSFALLNSTETIWHRGSGYRHTMATLSSHIALRTPLHFGHQGGEGT